MSTRLLIILGVFLLAQVLMTLSRAAFQRAVVAANRTLPAGEAVTRPRAIREWRAMRAKLRTVPAAAKELTQSDLLAGGGVVVLAATAIYVLATWDQA